MSIQKAEMNIERIENGQYVEQVVYPFVEYDHVAMENGMDIMSMIRDDVSTPMVTHNTTSWKVGQGDSDVSETIVDSSVGDMTIKGQTYQNILPNPSLRNSMTNGKTMQKLNEGYDSVNTVDGVCKSAILSGQTLVNLVPNKGENTIVGTGDRLIKYELPYILSKNKKYLLCCNIKTITTPSNTGQILFSLYSDDGNTTQLLSSLTSTGYLKTIFTTLDQDYSTQKLWVYIRNNETTSATFDNIMLLEYQDGMENWDIPYFEGMQSVKMPVLTTTGKNAWNTTKMNINFDSGLKNIQCFDNSIRVTNDYQGWRGLVFKNEQSLNYLSFNVSASKVNDTTKYIRVSSDGTQIGRYDLTVGRIFVQLPENSQEIKIQVLAENGVDVEFEFTDIQLEKEPFTSYEPFKSNILTVNEEVELRGVGDVKDELNLLTGELIENFETFTFNGSEDWRLQDDSLENTTRFILLNYAPNKVNNQKIGITNTYEWGFFDEDKPGIIITNPSGHVYLRTSKMSVDELKTMLSNNPIHGYYNKEKSIKTVDLSILDQDNQPIKQLNSFANGYIQVSSQEGTLIPTTEYEVPTSNSYHVDLMKANTQYTMKNMQGTFTIDGIQYNVSANGTFTSPSTLSNKFMVTSVAQSQPMLLEGDMTNKEVPYVEGNKSAFEGVDKVEIVSQNADNTLSNTTSFQLPHPLRSLPNDVRDEVVLDRQNHKARIIQRVGEDLTQLDTPIVTEVNLEGYPYVYKDGYIFLNTEIAPTTEVTYSINQTHQIESSNEDILRHQKEINHLYELIAQYLQVQYEAELIDIALQG